MMTRHWVSMHAATGRVADELSRHYDVNYLSVPIKAVEEDRRPEYALDPTRFKIVPQPYFESSLGAIPRARGIVKAYFRLCRACRGEDVFVRGMTPYIGALYAAAAWHRCNVCHWIVGDPITLLRTHRRRGTVYDFLAMAYSYVDWIAARVGRWLADGAFICNGEALGRAYRSPRTFATVSSTIREDEFYEREDTCQADPVRILYVGYVRPEKGLQYLFQAAAKLKTPRTWDLVIVGSWQKYPAYKRVLDQTACVCGIADRIRWEGHVVLGPKLLNYMRTCDLLVLPTLSEGTPHVLVEARANGLPVVSTTVGGVPTVIENGIDGLLVPPKRCEPLARAIDRVIADGELRRSLMRNGLVRAREQTVDRFIERVLDVMAGKRGSVT